MAAVTALLGSPPILAGPAATTGSLGGQDRTFLRQASESNLLQMQSEAVVRRKAQSARSRSFAREQAAARGRAEKGLQAFAAGLGVAIQEYPSAGEQQVIDRLILTPRRRFDAVYRQTVIRELTDDVARTRREISMGHDHAVKSYARKRLPALARQLRAARALPTAGRHAPP